MLNRSDLKAWESGIPIGNLRSQVEESRMLEGVIRRVQNPYKKPRSQVWENGMLDSRLEL